METAKKPGRPAKYSTAMSPNQRVRESRERAHAAMLQAHENLPGATTTALMANLAHQIKLIDTDKDHAPVAREIARDVMAELCKRYEI